MLMSGNVQELMWLDARCFHGVLHNSGDLFISCSQESRCIDQHCHSKHWIHNGLRSLMEARVIWRVRRTATVQNR